ncbi:hypothetical protein BC2230_30790 [Burkholderia cepacia]
MGALRNRIVDRDARGQRDRPAVDQVVLAHQCDTHLAQQLVLQSLVEIGRRHLLDRGKDDIARGGDDCVDLPDLLEQRTHALVTGDVDLMVAGSATHANDFVFSVTRKLICHGTTDVSAGADYNDLHGTTPFRFQVGAAIVLRTNIEINVL